MPKPELKPCPFCGDTLAWIATDACITGTQHYGYCPSCGCVGPWQKTKAGAVRMWNTRAKEKRNAKAD